MYVLLFFPNEFVINFCSILNASLKHVLLEQDCLSLWDEVPA